MARGPDDTIRVSAHSRGRRVQGRWHVPRSQDHGREPSGTVSYQCRATRRKRAAGRKRRRHVSDLAAELTDSAFHMHKTGRGAPGWRPHVGHAMAVYTDQEVVAESMIVVVSHHLALWGRAYEPRPNSSRVEHGRITCRSMSRPVALSTARCAARASRPARHAASLLSSFPRTASASGWPGSRSPKTRPPSRRAVARPAW